MATQEGVILARFLMGVCVAVAQQFPGDLHAEPLDRSRAFKLSLA